MASDDALAETQGLGITTILWSNCGIALKGTTGYNAVGYLTNYLYFAPRFRQMRVVTATEALRSRFDRTSEQSFLWISMIDGLLSAGQWLNGLAIITGAVFHLPVGTVIVATWLVAIAMALAGGARVMVASDYLQMLIVMAVTFTCAIVAHHTSWDVLDGNRQVTHPHPSFTPDSRRVLFTSNRDGKPVLYLTNLPPQA